MPTCAIVPVPPWTGQPSPVCPITTAQNKTYARGALSCLQVSKRSRWQCMLERRGTAWVPPGGQEIACDSHRLRNVHLDGHKDLHRHPRTTGPAPAMRIWVTPRTWMPLMRPVPEQLLSLQLGKGNRSISFLRLVHGEQLQGRDSWGVFVPSLSFKVCQRLSGRTQSRQLAPASLAWLPCLYEAPKQRSPLQHSDIQWQLSRMTPVHLSKAAVASLLDTCPSDHSQQEIWLQRLAPRRGCGLFIDKTVETC